MTREKEIKQSARKYIDTYIPDVRGICEQDIYETFINGAEWADEHPDLSSLWHDTSEEPKIGSNIVAIDKDGRLLGIQPYDDDYDRFGLEGWRRCVYLYNDIQKWAYISDLLPKGGGE